jgi:hypothetical protein
MAALADPCGAIKDARHSDTSHSSPVQIMRPLCHVTPGYRPVACAMIPKSPPYTITAGMVITTLTTNEAKRVMPRPSKAKTLTSHSARNGSTLAVITVQTFPLCALIARDAAPGPKRWRASCVGGITSERGASPGGAHVRRARTHRGDGWIPRARCAHNTNPTSNGRARAGRREGSCRDETTRPSHRPLYQGGARRPGRSGTVTVRERSPQPSNLRRPHPGNAGDDCEAPPARSSHDREGNPQCMAFLVGHGVCAIGHALRDIAIIRKSYAA